MKTIKIIGILLLKYICYLYIPACGILFMLCAGNTITFIIGLIITILSLSFFVKDNYKEVYEKYN